MRTRNRICVYREGCLRTSASHCRHRLGKDQAPRGISRKYPEPNRACTGEKRRTREPVGDQKNKSHDSIHTLSPWGDRRDLEDRSLSFTVKRKAAACLSGTEVGNNCRGSEVEACRGANISLSSSSPPYHISVEGHRLWPGTRPSGANQ